MNRTYVITGAASGTGAATAKTLREQGHTVIGVDLQGVEVAADLSTNAGRVEAAAKASEAAAGRVDAVIACAGIAAALETQGPQTGCLNYSSSKRALSRWVRRESISEAWAGSGIPVNAVAPGTVITPMTEDLLATPEGAAMVDAAVPMSLNSHQSAQSIADLLIWLTSEQNTHLAGQTISCDGGAEATLRGEDIWSWGDRK